MPSNLAFANLKDVSGGRNAWCVQRKKELHFDASSHIPANGFDKLLGEFDFHWLISPCLYAGYLCSNQTH